jgi:ribosomal protein S18 acetylase RimI-like enzyme
MILLGRAARIVPGFFMVQKIRKIEFDDLAAIVAMLREFAAFENLSQYCTVTEKRLQIAMFGDNAAAEGLIAVDDERPAGYALFYPNFSSFRGERGFHLDDIYIRNEYRGKGIGEAMLKEVARIAASRGYERIDFHVLDWNTPAVNFYKKLGAVCNDEETHFKFAGEAFDKLAA